MSGMLLGGGEMRLEQAPIGPGSTAWAVNAT
jgi:hypothetical protein